jgi:hypothetical protein
MSAETCPWRCQLIRTIGRYLNLQFYIPSTNENFCIDLRDSKVSRLLQEWNLIESYPLDRRKNRLLIIERVSRLRIKRPKLYASTGSK